MTASDADWLRLVEPHGQFLTLPVLRRVWPNGLDHLDADTRAEVRRRFADLAEAPPAPIRRGASVQRFFDMVHPEDRQRLLHNMDRIREPGEVFHVESP